MEEYFSIEDLNLKEEDFEKILNPVSEVQEQEKTQAELEDNKEKTEDVKVENQEKGSDDNTPDSTSTFSVFAKLLAEEGVLSLNEEDFKNIKNSEDLVKAISKQIEETKFTNLSESQKRYLESVEAGLPLNEFESLEKEIANIERIVNNPTLIEEDENIQLRFDLIVLDFVEKGLTKEKAESLANRSIKLNTDKEDAKEALDNIYKSKTELFKEKVNTKKEDNKLSLEKLKSEIASKEIILKDIKLSEKERNDIFNLVTTKVDTDDFGNPINEFNKWRKEKGVEGEILMAALYKLTNKFQDLSKIKETTKTKAASDLERLLRQSNMEEISKGIASNNFEINI